MVSDKTISVFVPTFNRCESLKLLLESLVRQTYKDFEVIVADGGSTDDTEKLIKTYSNRLNIIFFQQSREGIIGAANEAIEKASGEIFIRTDDDVTASENWLLEIVKTFEDEKVGGVTGPTIIPQDSLYSRDLTYFNEKLKNNPSIPWKLFRLIYYGYILENQPLAVSKFFRSGAFSLGSNYPECLKIRGNIEVDTLEACNWSCRKHLLLQIGGFDEKFLKGLGDFHEADAAFKIRRLGRKVVFNPKAIVNHNIGGGKVPKVRPRSYWRSQNFILFYFRHIKPNTLDKFCKFTCYLFFQNTYWLYKFLTSGDLSAFMGIPGTMVGLIKYMPEIKR